MGKFVSFSILICVVVLITTTEAAIRGDCPPSSQVSSCSPKCKNENDCSLGSKCCPNVCNANSCISSNAGSSGSGYKTGSSSATGTYCNNVKCNAYEKCALDRSTKRMKCVRA